jgi:hypothetical protein
VVDAPIAEVSGACIVADWVLLVGDRDPVLALAPWTGDLSAPWDLIDISELPGAPKGVGQFEAVEHIGGTVAGVLCEDPALLLAVDVAARRVIGHWRLRVDLPGLRKRWRKDAGSRGEGMVFGADRVFIIKEKKPAAWLEFAPAGAQAAEVPRPGNWQLPDSGDLHALRHRRIDADDISDATIVDGAIWLLSDQERSLIEYPAGTRHRLPKRIGKPEGAARTPDGRWLIAEDNRSGRDALHLIGDDELRPR